MNLGELRTRVHLELGEQTTFYTDAEVLDVGLNPAQRLLCLAYPLLLQKRAILLLSPDNVWSDLRQLTPTVRRLNRVVLGDVRIEPTQVPATGELRRLLPTHLSRLAGYPNWLMHQGQTRLWWTFGPFWFGVYARPMVDIQVTLLYDAMPTPMVLPSDLPDVSAIYHNLLVDIAAGLLLMKEGTPESTRGIARVLGALKGVQGDTVLRTA